VKVPAEIWSKVGDYGNPLLKVTWSPDGPFSAKSCHERILPSLTVQQDFFTVHRSVDSYGEQIDKVYLAKDIDIPDGIEELVLVTGIRAPLNGADFSLEFKDFPHHHERRGCVGDGFKSVKG
jgi:hypothetical protein